MAYLAAVEILLKGGIKRVAFVEMLKGFFTFNKLINLFLKLYFCLIDMTELIPNFHFKLTYLKQ